MYPTRLLPGDIPFQSPQKLEPRELGNLLYNFIWRNKMTYEVGITMLHRLGDESLTPYLFYQTLILVMRETNRHVGEFEYYSRLKQPVRAWQVPINYNKADEITSHMDRYMAVVKILVDTLLRLEYNRLAIKTSILNNAYIDAIRLIVCETPLNWEPSDIEEKNDRKCQNGINSC